LQLGAKYFRGRKPRRLVDLESGHDRSSATKREMEIKKLKRKDKFTLLSASENQINIESKS
jgi:putative endonuclease